MKTMKLIKINVLVLLFFMLSCTFLFAQPIPPAPQTPISGGLGIIIILASLFGLKKYFKNRK